MTYKQIGIPPNEAQFLETRKYQTEEICRIYRVAATSGGQTSTKRLFPISSISLLALSFTPLDLGWFDSSRR